MCKENNLIKVTASNGDGIYLINSDKIILINQAVTKGEDGTEVSIPGTFILLDNGDVRHVLEGVESFNQPLLKKVTLVGHDTTCLINLAKIVMVCRAFDKKEGSEDVVEVPGSIVMLDNNNVRHVAENADFFLV